MLHYFKFYKTKNHRFSGGYNIIFMFAALKLSFLLSVQG